LNKSYTVYNITIVTSFAAPPTFAPTVQTEQPFFSVLIVNWNSAQYLSECLQALSSQTLADFEVLLLDNGSANPFPIELLGNFPDLNLKFFQSETNLGFAGGNNLLARCAIGNYLILLNADAFPEANWLETIRRAVQRYPDTFFASKLISARNPALLDGEWNVYHASGLTWRHNHAKAAEHAATHDRAVFSACAAAGAYPRAAFETVHGFDEDFFAYMEDVDLDFRLQLAGYPCVYLADATVRHIGAGSTASRSGFMLRHGHRNLIWAFIKNMPGGLFWLLLPAHILANLLYVVFSFFIRDGSQLRQGKLEALRGLNKVWAKRRQIQRERKVSVWAVARQLDWNPFSPLIKMTYK